MKNDESIQSEANVLCKSCGLCCSGHLFAWVKLRSPELDPLESLGVNVLREPRHRGFSQPCPLWNGECTIYTSPQYPRACHTYKCQLLKKVLDDTVALTEALSTIQQAKVRIAELESLLPDSSNGNFRERLVAHHEHGAPDLDFRQRANALLIFYREQFGVKDLVDIPDDG